MYAGVSGGSPATSKTAAAKVTAAARKAICRAMKQALADVAESPCAVTSPSSLHADTAADFLPLSVLQHLELLMLRGTDGASSGGAKGDHALGDVEVWKRAFRGQDGAASARGDSTPITNPTAMMVALAMTMPGLYNVVRKMLELSVQCAGSSTTTAHCGTGYAGDTHTRAYTHVPGNATVTPARPTSTNPVPGGSASLRSEFTADTHKAPATYVPQARVDVDGGDDDESSVYGGEEDLDASGVEAHELASAGRGHPEPMDDERRTTAELAWNALQSRTAMHDPIDEDEDFTGPVVYMTVGMARKHIVQDCVSAEALREARTAQEVQTLKDRARQRRVCVPATSPEAMHATWCSDCVAAYADDCVDMNTEVQDIMDIAAAEMSSRSASTAHMRRSSNPFLNDVTAAAAAAPARNGHLAATSTPRHATAPSSESRARDYDADADLRAAIEASQRSYAEQQAREAAASPCVYISPSTAQALQRAQNRGTSEGTAVILHLHSVCSGTSTVQYANVAALHAAYPSVRIIPSNCKTCARRQ